MQSFQARRAVRQALADWREQGLLGADGVATAWPPTEPDAGGWRTWLDRALLALGAALLCAGVIVFFAFNWQDLHKFAKFGLLAGALSLLAAFALLRPPADMAGRAALCGAQVVAGVLLAVIGQVYQSGADAWQLFALWALLAVPWALAARAAPHWWLVIVLANVALLRYLSVRLGVGGMFDLLFRPDSERATTLLLLGAALLQLACWFALCALAPVFGFRGLAGARILAALACGYAGWLGLGSILHNRFDPAMFGIALLALGGLLAWFRLRAFDVVALSLASFSGIVVLVTAVARLLLDVNRAGFGAFLLLGLLTIGLSATAATWLLRAYRQHGPADAGGTPDGASKGEPA
ncbi:DUF2157 domain-containing protein [Cupriavidus basilensis]|uniref:DUF2157 domain-containing protein n=1 Tax=Cupriavidus basilensis TaxID=68895 RepID=A0ABT6AQH2_9BURK|nr:DUF2157 domain-containing protein [Cupriavidus basilensis]MDF3834856.1 DUF2157 domain-containing protein [Cupriavidus basilensis]